MAEKGYGDAELFGAAGPLLFLVRRTISTSTTSPSRTCASLLPDLLKDLNLDVAGSSW